MRQVMARSQQVLNQLCEERAEPLVSVRTQAAQRSKAATFQLNETAEASEANSELKIISNHTSHGGGSGGEKELSQAGVDTGICQQTDGGTGSAFIGSRGKAQGREYKDIP